MAHRVLFVAVERGLLGWHERLARAADSRSLSASVRHSNALGTRSAAQCASLLLQL